jgi:hypothetical protein
MNDVDAARVTFDLYESRLQLYITRLRETLVSFGRISEIQTDKFELLFLVRRNNTCHLEVRLWMPDRSLVEPDLGEEEYGKSGKLQLSLIEESHRAPTRVIHSDTDSTWISYSDFEQWDLHIRRLEDSSENLSLRIKQWIKTGN